MSVKGKRVGFIGGGNMGEALIKGLLGASLVPPDVITATDVRTERASQLTRQFGISAHGDNARCVRDADVVILAVKPQIMTDVLRAIAPAVGPGTCSSRSQPACRPRTIRSGLGKEARIIRVMPNTPALVLQGATAIAKGKGLGPDDLGTAEEIFGAVGRVVVLDEELMDAVTGLSGSGPAYVAIVIESLADGGVEDGPRPGDRDDAGHADRAGRRPAAGRDRAAPRRASRTWSRARAAPRSPASRRWRRAVSARHSSARWSGPPQRSRELGRGPA